MAIFGVAQLRLLQLNVYEAGTALGPCKMLVHIRSVSEIFII